MNDLFNFMHQGGIASPVSYVLGQQPCVERFTFETKSLKYGVERVANFASPIAYIESDPPSNDLFCFISEPNILTDPGFVAGTEWTIPSYDPCPSCNGNWTRCPPVRLSVPGNGYSGWIAGDKVKCVWCREIF